MRFEIEILEFFFTSYSSDIACCVKDDDDDESRTQKAFKMKIKTTSPRKMSEFFYGASKTRKTLFKRIFVCSPYVNGRFILYSLLSLTMKPFKLTVTLVSASLESQSILYWISDLLLFYLTWLSSEVTACKPHRE